VFLSRKENLPHYFKLAIGFKSFYTIPIETSPIFYSSIHSFANARSLYSLNYRKNLIHYSSMAFAAQVRDRYDQMCFSLSLRINTVFITSFNSRSCFNCSRSFLRRILERFFSNRYRAPLNTSLFFSEAFRYSALRTLSITRMNWETT